MAKNAIITPHVERQRRPLADLLNDYHQHLHDKQATGPGKWAIHNAGFKLIKHDLTAARSAWLAEADTAAERAKREQTDFLCYADRDGNTADFHSLRHTFITNLVKAGVQPKDAKELARHSTITLTMDRYAHVGLKDTAAAVGRLPGFAGSSTGAADSDNGRGVLRTVEETSAGERPTGGSSQGLNLQAAEENREELKTVEGSTPDRSRTCNLRLRRPTLYPVELRVRDHP